MIRGAGFWTRAQTHEVEAWRESGHAPAPYLARRGALLDAWIGFWRKSRHRRVLEIGGAGLPLVDYLNGYEERHAVDPLMDEYKRLFGDAPGGVRHRAARAEELPYPAGHFDAVVMLNVLDHVEDPASVLKEIRRVLNREGLLFLSCDTYARTWLALRSLRLLVRGRRRNDILHPHHFTPERLARLLADRFRLLEIRSCFGDPLAGEHRIRKPYPLGGFLNRLKQEGRIYVAARPLS